MGKTPQRRFALTLFPLVALMVSVAACGDDDAVSDTEADTAEVAVFCANPPDPPERPETYVGSAEHVEDLRQLHSRAPTELRNDLDLIIRHFDSAVDPSDPASQLTENFPEGVNAAIARVTAYIEEKCVD